MLRILVWWVSFAIVVLTGKLGLMNPIDGIRRLLIVALLFGFILTDVSCYPGGGNGEYYPLGVAVNKLELKRTDLDSSGDLERPREILGDKNDDFEIMEFMSNPTPDEFTFANETYFTSRKFSFGSKQFKIAVPIENWVSIFDLDNKHIKSIGIPRYSSDAIAFEMLSGDAKLLVVYVQQQATSRSSTLFILDEAFKIVYEEHLLEGY